jgi:hypothetical protein
MGAYKNQSMACRSEARSRDLITARHRRRGLLRAAMLSTAAGLAGLVLPTASPVGAQVSESEGTKIAAIYQLQAAFHQAKSHQDIDLMMSLWASDATFSVGDNVISGADQVQLDRGPPAPAKRPGQARGATADSQGHGYCSGAGRRGAGPTSAGSVAVSEYLPGHPRSASDSRPGTASAVESADPVHRL